MELQLGDIVTGMYKTGKYIGEITNIRPEHYVVRVLCVLKHPTQGDLHNVKQTDVQLFHERRALAYREQTNIPRAMVKKYDGDVINYTISLQEALKKQMTTLEQEDSAWATQCISVLENLQKEYKI